MKFPANLKYTLHDEWVRIEGDTFVLGITDYAQDALGELVHVELPEVGKKVGAGAAIAEVESVKAVAEVYSPVSGEVVEVNDDIDGNEDNVNSDPYGKGWLVKIRPDNAGALSALMDVAAYERKIADN